jgi:hypothetical protein
MLPAVKKTATALVTALTLVSVAAIPANAGPKGDAFVKGVLATLIVGAIVQGVTAQRAAAQQPAQRQYVQPRPQQPRKTTYQQPVYQQPVYPQPPRYTPPAPSASLYQSPAARAFASYSLTERRTIQRSLAARGYYSGAIDGAFGPGTFGAITAYARDTRTTNRLETTAGVYGIYDSLIA